MLTKELALKVLKELSISNFEYCINEKKLLEEEATKLSMRLYNHCLIVGTIAEKIAKKIELDDDKCYIFGLLHDIGKFKPNRFHGLVGYEIAMENNEEELAKICLTHCFLKDNEKIGSFDFPNNEFKEQDIIKTKRLLNSFEINDYDKLIRLCDFLSIGDTLNSVTIEDRLLDLITRYSFNENDYNDLFNEINGLKNYFENKFDFDLYELLEKV